MRKRYYFKQDGKDNYLTSRELEFLYWLSLGKTASETARILHIGQRTAEVHVNNIKTKLGCATLFQLGQQIEKLNIGIIPATKNPMR